jgi:outer membrane protein TolC
MTPRTLYALLFVAVSTPAHAQAPVTLGALHRAAERHDPRAEQASLLVRQAEFRHQNIAAEHLPSLSVLAQSQYLSDVTTIGAALPGLQAPQPPKAQFDSYLSLRQRLYDPTRAARRRVETAQLSEQQARLQTALYRQRQQVNDAWFAARRADVQLATLATAITDLSAQIRQAEARRALGATLPSELHLLQVELLRREQAVGALQAERQAALSTLQRLTGVAMTAPLSTATASDSALTLADTTLLRARREYAQYDAARGLLAERQALLARQDAPRVNAFARSGYGRPGLNQLARSFDSYWLAGVQVEWAPWTWGNTRREQESQVLQREIIGTEEAAFTRELRDAAARLTTTIAELDRTLARDADIVTLRTRILRETRARFAERVVTLAEVVDRETDVLAAELDRDGRLVQRDELRARLLTLLGRDLP